MKGRSEEALSSMADADLLLVTGGTAKGKKDVTRSSFQACGATFLLEALPVVPGKTMTFGKLDQTPFFILPGNPRALRTLYEVFIRPCLLKLAGRIEQNAHRQGIACLRISRRRLTRSISSRSPFPPAEIRI